LAPLEGVVGHDETKRRLMRFLDQDRLPNGILLTGSDGRGKRTLALAFAAEVIARGTPEAGRAAAGRRAREGSHPELIVCEPLPDERFLPVRRVRRLLERCALSIGEGARRMVVLPRLQKLNEESGNALLKFMEEPPPGTMIVATAHDPSSVLETIRSRLRLLPTTPLSDEDVARTAVAHGADPAGAVAAAPIAEGAPGAVFRLLRGDPERALWTPLRELAAPEVSPYAWAERRTKEAKEDGPAWVEAEERLGPPAAVTAFAELRAAKEEGADGEKTGTGGLEASRAWLRPLLTAAVFSAQDALRAAVGATPRAPGLALATGAARDLSLGGASRRLAAARAGLVALENLDRNLSLPLCLEAFARAFRTAT
jgi:DNA polymerase-3 subunit delta'